jgi:hypothetical protein
MASLAHYEQQRDFNGRSVTFIGHYVSANSLFAAHGAGATASGGDKRVGNWWNSFTNAYGESELLRHMAEMEGRDAFREISWEKSAEIPADYFLCQSSPLVIKVGGMGRKGTDYLLSRAPALKAAAYLSPALEAWVYTTMARLIQEGPQDQPELRAYFKRFSLFPKKNLRPKHWCVFLEIPELLEITHERMRLDVGQRDLIDGSVGKMWSKYRNGKDWAVERHELPYTFPGETKPYPIWQYHNSELPFFREWLNEVYEPEHLYRYTERKYGEIPAVALSGHYQCDEKLVAEFASKRRTQKQMDRLLFQAAEFASMNPRAQMVLPLSNGNWLSRVY